MNEINMNKFGMPKSGVEVLREKMFGGMSLEDGPELPELELPEFGNVAEEPVLMGGVQRMVDKAKGLVGGKEAEAKWRINGLRSLVLMDRDAYFKDNVTKHPELNYLTPDRVRADKKGFNMLLGGELSRVIGDGNTYGVLNAAIESMPEEERLGAKARLQQCDTEYKAHELLGELWSGLMQRDFDEAKAKYDAEVKVKKERASAALAAVNEHLSATWVQKIMGLGYLDPVAGLYKQEAISSGAMTPEQFAELEKTSARAHRAFNALITIMHDGDVEDYLAVQSKVANKAAEIQKKENEKKWRFAWEDIPTKQQIWQQAASDVSESYKVDRVDMNTIYSILKKADGTLDETAFKLFVAACYEASHGEQPVLTSQFWDNLTSAIGDWGSESADYLKRLNLELASSTGVDLSAGLALPASLFNLEGNKQQAQKLLDIYYSPEIEKMKGMLNEVEGIRRSPAEGMPWVQATLTEFGETVGDSAPFLVGSAIHPALGYAAFFPARTNEAIATNYYKGVKNPVAMAHIEGAWDTLAEGLFAKAVGKLPGVSKGLDWVGLKTVSVPAIGKTLGRIQGNAALRVSTNIALESVGELIVENVVAETGTYATVKLLRALGVDFAEPEWKPFESSWQMMQNSSQTGATVAYCASLGLLGVPANRRAARDFAKSRKFLLEVGLTEGGVAEVQAAHAEYQKSASAALVREKYRLEKVRAEAGEKAVEEAENKAGRPLEGAAAEKIRAEAGEKAVAEEVEKILAEQQGALDKTMRRVYDRDVLHEDPVALKKRMEKRGEKFLEDVEVKLYAESGVRDAVLAEAGVTVGEKSEKGLRKVQFKGEKEGEVKEVEWTDEQLNAYVAMQREGGMAKRMRYFQTRVAGTALAEAEVTDASVKHELVNMRALPARALARMQRNGGKVDYAVMQDLAEDAAEKISGFVAGGMSGAEARAQMSELPGVTLGTLVQSANAFVQRVEELVGTAEGRALGINRVEDAVTNVFRMKRANAPGQSVLLYNKGLASEREVVEDLLESDVVAAVEGEHASTSWEALEGMLRRVEGELMKYGGGRLFSSKEKASQMAIIEAFSKLGQSYFLLNHGKYQMSAEAHGTIEYVQKKMADAQHLVAMSHAWEAFAKSKEGKAFLKKEGASFEKLLSDAGASVAGHYAAAKFDAAAFAAVREAYEGSIVPSLEAAKPVLEQYEAEQKELDRPAAEAEELVVPADESVTGEELKLEPEAVVDDSTGDFVAPPGAEVLVDKDEGGPASSEGVTPSGYAEARASGFAEATPRLAEAPALGRGLANGAYVLMEDGSVYGVALVEDVQLSADVPQFKKKESAAGRVEADADGTTHELAGGWNANSAPIHVWRRVDGRLEVISGRHRLAHAKKNGVKHIAVRVYDEAAGYDAKWAKLHDVEQNILDNTCNAIDVAYYFRHNPMPLGEAEARGLMPKTKQGEQTAASRMGLHVAAHASEDTFAMLVNGGCTAEDAYMACLVAASAEGQQLALEARAGKKGKKNSWEYVTALVRGAEQLAPADGGGMLDLFGNDESFRESSEKMARYVAAVRAGLKARLNVLQSAGRLNKKESVSKELGVKVKAPKDALRLIERIAMLDAAYERLDYELGIPAKVEAWDGKSAVPTKLDELEAKGTGVSYSLVSAEMDAIKAAAVADGTFMKAPNGKPSNLNERQWLQVRTAAFKEWFGDWKRAAELTFVPAAAGWKETKNALKSLKGVPLRNLEKGIIGYVNRDQRNELSNPNKARVSADNGFSSAEHYVAAQHIQELFKHATWCGVYNDDAGHSDLEMLRFVCPFRYDGVLCYAFITAKRSLGGQDSHDTKVYNLELMDTIRLDSKLRDKAQYAKEPKLSSKEIITRVEELSKTYFDNVSKIVDENGEPKVMYHGSPVSGIREFEMHKAVHGEGAFFTDSPEEALSYTGLDEYDFEDWDEFDAYATESGLLYEVFLNIRDRDRLYERSGGAWHARAIAPNEIKSATDNRGTFDGSNPDITFSMERNLAAVHSLSADKFLGALELGGMPLPSVAVTRLDKPYSWGSEKHIYLVGRPELVDPRRGTDVYSADAWTGKFPRVVHKHIESADFKEAVKAAGKLEDKYGHVFYELANKLRQADTRSDLEYLLSSDTGKALFACMQGYEPKAKTVEKPMDYQFLDKQFAKDTRNMWENGDAIKEGHELAFADAVEASLERWLAAHKDAKMHALYRKLYSDLLSDLRRGRPYGVWFKLKMSLNNMGKRELDAHGNREMLAKYADKHKKAFAAWVQEKVDKWRSKEGYIRENGKEATLDNVVSYMLSKKGLNNEEFMGFSPGKLRAALSAKMRSLDDIKARREQLGDSAESKASKEPSEQLMMEYCRFVREHLKEADADSFYAMDYGLESLSLVKGKPTEEKVARAVRKVFSYTKAGDAMAQDEELLLKGVEAVESVRREVEDYMEAVPQRAVKMDEWEYAVLPEELKKNKAVMAGLRENGIRPRFHDGTEEGRKAALAGLVNDSRVSFSVIGQKAATWDKYADRAFKGRDDGKLRAEIDASGARLKSFAGAAADDYRREVENVQDFWRERYGRWLELDALFDAVYYSDEEATEEQRAEADAAKEEYYSLTEEVKDMMEALIERGGAWRSYSQLEAADKQALRMGMVRSLAEGKVDEAVYEKLGALSAGERVYRLDDVLDFPELFDAYPVLKEIPVVFELLGRYNGLVSNYAYGAEYSVIKLNNPLLENVDALRSTLLHEVQHVIQRIEGYAKGGNVEGVYKQMKEDLEFNEWEMKRLARELRWFSALDYAKDYLKSARRLLRYPNAWKYNGLRYHYWKAALGNEDMTRLLVDDIAGRYEELRKDDEVETRRRGNRITPKEYVLPVVDFSDLAGVERGLAALEGVKPRRSAFRGVAPKKDKEYVKLMKYTNAAKRMLDKYELEPYELYRRLAGEIEARNVQERRDWTAEQRLARPFNETLEYPGEALVTFSVIGPKAKTWDKYADRAFKGRDDGKLRAEIDASKAKLKWEDLRGRNVAAYRRIVDDWYKLPDEECKTIESYAELYYDWQDELAKLNSISQEDKVYFEVYKAVAKLRSELNEKRGGVRKLLGKWFVERGGGAAVMMNANNDLVDELAGSLWGPYMDSKVADELDLQPLWHGGMALQDVLEYDELYEAYPELAQLHVETAKFEGAARGCVIYRDGQYMIQINKNLEGEWAQFYSVLMHEIQHVIQYIEGFAKGGNPQSARDVVGNYKRRYEIENESSRLRLNIAWLEGYDVARREFLNIGDAISMREDKEKLQDLRDKYNNLAYQYNKGAIAEPGFNGEDGRDSSFVIPSLSGVTKGAYAKAQKAWDMTQDRKAAFPGMLEKLRARYDELWAEWGEMNKRQQRWGALSSPELYLRLAGEIEARNVQSRVRMSAAERMNMPFNETLEYPGEALVTFSIQGIIADWNMEVDNFVQNPPVHKSAEWDSDVYVCPTPAVMRMVGAAPLDIVMSHHVLAKVLDKDTLLGNGKTIGKMYPKEPDMGKHKMTVDELRKLPISLTSPVCIAESNRKGSIEVITDMQENGVNVLVAVQLEVAQGSSQYIKVNRIASLYGKEKIEQLVKHPMLYVNTAKAHKWLVARGLQLPTRPNLIAGSKNRVLTPTDLVKYKFANGLSFSLSGRGMIDAAPLGRMAGEDKMQRLLNYAKKEAGRWTRTFGKDTPNARAAEAMGTVSSILASIHKELPPRFRPRVEGHMRYVEVYARLLESGKVRSYGRLSKEQRAVVEAELLDVLQDAKAMAEEEYELAKKEALDAAELTGEMAAMEAAEEMDVDDEVKRRGYLDRLAKRTADATRRRLLAEAEAKKKQLEADIDALTRDFAAEKLAQIASRMLNEAADAVEAYLIDEELGAVDVLMERLAPRKLPNGKYDKGRMSADAYRKFVSYVELMNKSKAEVAEKMEQLGREIAAEEAKSEEERMDDGSKLDALTEELAAWSTYGGLRGKNLEGVRKGVAALGEFAAYEKNVWSSLLKLQRNRAKRQALVAAQGLGGADEFKVKEETEKQAKLLQRLKDLGAGLQSIGQIFYGLGGVPKMRALVDESLDALSAGHVALASREKRAFEQLADYMGEAMGLKTERQRNNFMAELKKKHKTNIYREGELVRHRLRLTLDEAAVWLEMTKAERDAKRAELEAAADKQGVLAENVPYEEDIPLIREELRRIQEEESSAKYVKTVREFRKDALKEPMVLSKDEALNILLLCEQADYIDAAHENGYTDEVLAKLAEFVGSEVLGFGYAMREVLENNGLAEVYEAREGVPFPKVENYWPGHFDQSARVNEQANALDPTSGGGTRYGMLITRVKHKLKFNLMGASNVFMAALAQQNNYICMGELTAKWRRLLSHNDFAMAMKQHLGVAQFKQFKELIELLDGAGVQESITQQTLSGLLGQFQSAHAMAVLAGSPITLVKQLSAMMNAGAWEGISCSRVLARIVLDRFGGGAIKYGDMLQKDYFQARYRDKRYFTEMMQLGRDANWSVLSAWARGGMRWIEKMDVLTNCASMTALYNITYHDLKKRNEGAADAMTEEEMHAECDRVVRNTLELGAQPLRRTQKSAFAALSRNALVKATCYMGSEALNKLGMTLSMKRRTGGGAKGFLKAWKYLAGVSIAQQVIVMLLDMARNADPVDEDEWAEWLLLNLATGASGLGLLQSVPVLGEAVQKLTGGYVKTGSLGQMIYDFEGMWRSGKKVVTMAADEKDDSWADWAWAGADLGRRLTFLTGAWGGINSSSKGASELAGLLQSLNAMANTVRPVVQAERNDEKRMKAYRKKVEKGLAKARKATREREKQEREAEEAEKKAEREKREKAKRREERLKRL